MRPAVSIATDAFVATQSGAPKVSPIAALALLAVYLPYAVKRAVLFGTPGELEWLAWDYSTRAVSLLGVFMYWRAGLLNEIRRRASIWTTILALVSGLFFLFVLDAQVFPRLAENLPYFQLFHPPIVGNRALLVFDLTIGLALVSISEELAFRLVAFSVLRRAGLGDKSVILLSALAFALVHLTSGVDAALNVFLVGLVLGTVFHVTGRLSICVVLHYFDHALGFARLLDEAGLARAV